MSDLLRRHILNRFPFDVRRKFDKFLRNLKTFFRIEGDKIFLPAQINFHRVRQKNVVQIVRDHKSFCAGYSVPLDELPGVFRLYPMLRRCVDVVEVKIFQYRLRREILQVVRVYHVKPPEIIIDAQPPKNFSRIFEPIKQMRRAFIDDENVMRLVFPISDNVGQMIFFVKVVNRVFRIKTGIRCRVQHTSIQSEIQKFGTKLMTDFKTAAVKISGTEYINFCVGKKFHCVTLRFIKVSSNFRERWLQRHDLLISVRRMANDFRACKIFPGQPSIPCSGQ